MKHQQLVRHITDNGLLSLAAGHRTNEVQLAVPVLEHQLGGEHGAVPKDHHSALDAEGFTCFLDELHVVRNRGGVIDVARKRRVRERDAVLSRHVDAEVDLLRIRLAVATVAVGHIVGLAVLSFNMDARDVVDELGRVESIRLVGVGEQIQPHGRETRGRQLQDPSATILVQLARRDFEAERKDGLADPRLHLAQWEGLLASYTRLNQRFEHLTDGGVSTVAAPPFHNLTKADLGKHGFHKRQGSCKKAFCLEQPSLKQVNVLPGGGWPEPR